jgi:hypothetical protein
MVIDLGLWLLAHQRDSDPAVFRCRERVKWPLD